MTFKVDRHRYKNSFPTKEGERYSLTGKKNLDAIACLVFMLFFVLAGLHFHFKVENFKHYSLSTTAIVLKVEKTHCTLGDFCQNNLSHGVLITDYRFKDKAGRVYKAQVRHHGARKSDFAYRRVGKTFPIHYLIDDPTKIAVGDLGIKLRTWRIAELGLFGFAVFMLIAAIFAKLGRLSENTAPWAGRDE